MYYLLDEAAELKLNKWYIIHYDSMEDYIVI